MPTAQQRLLDDELCAAVFLAGVLGRALDELDVERDWRDGRRVLRTRGQLHEKQVVDLLVRQLTRIARRYAA